MKNILLFSSLVLLAAMASTTAKAEAHFAGCFSFGANNCPPGSGVKIVTDFKFGQPDGCTASIKNISAANGLDVAATRLLSDENGKSSYEVTFVGNEQKSVEWTFDNVCNLIAANPL